MQFTRRKRRGTPSVIIVSLIDVLMVVLIFLVVSTTFKQKLPAIQIQLPGSVTKGNGGTSRNEPLVVTINKTPPHLYLGTNAVSAARLEFLLKVRRSANPVLALTVRSDTDAPLGQFIKVHDAARAAGITNIQTLVKPLP
ncbi:MAG: biopolymer transporter ExbD [Verrucomicrobiota bacterium]|nr:biopolymer transporter ExbD [Verrucomicrobiota bacterium]